MKWPTVKLNSICRPRQWKTISSNDLLESGYPVYGANGKIGFYSEYTHDTPTLMITCRGATCGNVHISEPKSYINGNAMALDNLDQEAIDIKYLYYFLLGRGFQDVISGSAQPQITGQGLTKVEIPLPPLEEQKRIAAILDKADAIRRKRQQAIQLADDFLRSVFLDMFGDPVTNPKGWPTATLDSICVRKGEYGSNQPATNFEEGDYRYIRITDIQDDGSLKEERVSLENQETEALKYTLAHGDLLFARSGATVGKTYLYDEKEGPCIFAGYLIRFKVIPEKAHPEFIKAVCNTQAYWNWVKSCQNVVAQPNINAKQYGQEFTFILPPLELQQKFIELTNKVKTQIAKNKKLNSSNLFDSLSQKAFRGEL